MPFYTVDIAADGYEVHFWLVELGEDDEVVRDRQLWSAAYSGDEDRKLLFAFGKALDAVAGAMPAAIARGLTGPAFVEVLAELASFILEGQLGDRPEGGRPEAPALPDR